MKPATVISAASKSYEFYARAHYLHYLLANQGFCVRKQLIRGLWIRGARYYARLNLGNPLTGIKKNRRVPLIGKEGNPVQTVAPAVVAIAILPSHRRWLAALLACLQAS